jgi:hypothetical protein
VIENVPLMLKVSSSRLEDQLCGKRRLLSLQARELSLDAFALGSCSRLHPP